MVLLGARSFEGFDLVITSIPSFFFCSVSVSATTKKHRFGVSDYCHLSISNNSLRASLMESFSFALAYGYKITVV